MKNKPLLFLLSVCGLLAISARGENPPAKVIFEQYMNQAQTFADNYPREKAYLHFDNTSYYVGDDMVQSICHSCRKTSFQFNQPSFVCGTGRSGRARY